MEHEALTSVSCTTELYLNQGGTMLPIKQIYNSGGIYFFIFKLTYQNISMRHR